MPTDFISEQALDWALAHVGKFGDTDLFPVPFEFKAIRQSWRWLRPLLAGVDMNNYRTRAHRRSLVPKPGGGFRVATQLDPLDSLRYTAMVFEAAAAIERSRVPSERRIACSYRLALDDRGTFFPTTNGWDEFHQRSRELAESGEYSHVLMADIGDFYNQIYHHRLENALTSANIPEVRAKNLIAFIAQLTAKQTRGIPVGPAASIVLAEVCLNDVDMFLLRTGRIHVRYVDDFRIYCRTRREALVTLHDLTDYLYTSHRLTLETNKTHIKPVDSFMLADLTDPEQEERRGRIAAMTALVAQLGDEGTYDQPSVDSPAPTAVSQAIRDNLSRLFRECVNTAPLHLGVARHALRRATRLRTNLLLPLVFANFDVLAPVLRDVARYVKAALRDRSAPDYGIRLQQFIASNDSAVIPYIQLWYLEMLAERPTLLSSDVAMQLAEAASANLGLRPLAQLARAYGALDWVRSKKETWENNAPWDRRAIIWSAKALTEDERRHWLAHVQGAYDPLDRAVANSAA